MLGDDVVIDIRDVSKCYEMYASPLDRAKQIILPNAYKLLGQVGRLFGSDIKPPPAYYKEYWALRNVSFQMRRGETLGIIGRNGGGKSTLLQIIAGTLTPTHGERYISGRIAALLELGSGFNPEYTGRENVFFNGYILGLTQKEILEKYDQIVEFADIGDFIDQPVKTYSSGMFVRLAFAVQAHVDASIVIIDEALAVGDVFFRQKCYARLEKLKESGAAIILVSHSMTEIEEFCDRAILLEHGHVKFVGKSEDATRNYYVLHQQEQNKSLDNHVSENIQKNQIATGLCLPSKCPTKEGSLDLSNKLQVGNGYGRCVKVALCNEAGNISHHFFQGEKAFFYSEFELHKKIDIPIFGLIIKNDRGMVVYGKNSTQYEGDVPHIFTRYNKLYCKQEVSLDLGLGEYTFGIGFSTISAKDWLRRQYIPYEELSAKLIVISSISDIGAFSIGFARKNGVSILTHHGLANLPGSQSIGIEILDDQEVDNNVFV